MTTLFNSSAALRNLVGVVAAVLMGSTFLLAATAPAITTGVQVAANSDIVSVA